MSFNEAAMFTNPFVTGVVIEPYTRHMHMSLAYRFADEHQSLIEDLASKIDTSAKCKWELRVYSRDRRVSSHEVQSSIRCKCVVI